MRPDHQILGFDVRMPVLASSTQYCGVDATCWERPQPIAQYVEDGKRWVGPNGPLWEDYQTLVDYVKDFGLQDVVFICITLDNCNDNIEIESLPNAGDGFLYVNAADNLLLADHWQHLGFDVADSFLASALCTYSHIAHDAERCSKTASGCIANFEEANGLRAIVTDLIPEHRPFFVFSVFKVQ